ncbi:hypothetical protein B9Q03_00110 [Candidatus Marsarchaeota G2 archaeon OSP_D]|jgi:Predicted nucleic acid-binding protein, consists of a PIN domain and a Zn-ribbon module|uniref:Ribonuclease PIN domain-containing protein n=7 Tax=Candidatus Marsarchaeota group 2 TaxID=2203771 RepID=A0A2R6CAE1_9ARCH|nr:MAG: hypothetical protein B9Q08_01470 [Candidatus Marsarchaeota G2 archaeon ECH_B_SAG-M15]PSN92630.1 MAG: hypothetical protein B9Q03_00110 [Candidatus Marsarchaeota G2 archaeon OSP_D]PSN93592.1 MAG: hypothetical protein B9Q09_05590 [Candidatus Marsarchaeota G2 archaeon ECH_B_SAG-C16]PSN96730.1 MAG: hypothetical protein B9Q06_00875 [Candidatus Marsarchaeota G2 archaeon ECH_B_2]PSO01298.1 MAG: hypothetical protein B9Q07_00280 [Candidatus Marsarchaeota G2 archaeon ECH_B_3]PSO03432.1 MAG: hypot
MSGRQSAKSVVVLDTAAILSGCTSPTNDNYTVNGVLRELEKFGVDFELAPFSPFVTVMEPSEEYIACATMAASKTGDSVLLSEIDLSLIGLALQLRKTDGRPVELFTDDYALTNVARFLGLKHSFVGLRKEGFNVIKWIWFCPSCHRVYFNGRRVCPDCGTKLKRKPR